MRKHPVIIQGGMGAGVSAWPLARAVAKAGQLGVVSGTALDLIFVRRLQTGDEGGHMRRAAAAFPDQKIAQRFVDKYYVPGGKAPDAPFMAIPLFSAKPTRDKFQLAVLGSFVEVWLAKEGHDGLIGINLLEKIQLPNLPTLYGAMLANVDYVLMGAGIPWEIPGILDRFANHEPAGMRLSVEGAGSGEEFHLTLDPHDVMQGLVLPPLLRPQFLTIIASATVALSMIKRATGRLDGFVIEGPKAGGHNAPPRGQLKLTESGEPLYGPRDEVDLVKMRELGLPFWLAGTYGRPGMLPVALESGAAGIQVGTAFAFCAESGLDPGLRRSLLSNVAAGKARVHTDPLASPTGFPFKVAVMDGTISEPEVYSERPRRCDAGYLRHLYRKEDGQLGYRCPAEPIENFLTKGGAIEDTVGRKCLCNGLMANIGMPQIQKSGYVELPLITSGDDLLNLSPLMRADGTDYTALDVINMLMAGVPANAC